MTQPLDILIVGAGIAGCCAAIALTQRGHRVLVVEKQEQWRFQSSGIFVYANGLVSLKSIGLLDDVLAAGFPVESGRNLYFDHHGAPIVETIYPSADDGHIPPILGIKRAELHRVMSEHASDLGVPIKLGTTVAAIETEDDAVAVTLSDGSLMHPDLVLGADGVRSATRKMIGIDIDPRYTGFGVWRAVHSRPPDLTEKIMMMGPAKRFGIMPISNDLLYTFGTIVEPKENFYAPDTWAAEMASKFAEFEGLAAPFLTDLSITSEVLYTAVEEIALPLPWHRGRVLLIGDAAHASTPFMGQGGAMAMQDAVVLAQTLDSQPTVEAALTAFGTARFPVCEFVQNASRAVGEAGARDVAGNEAQRNAGMRATAQANVDSFYQKLNTLSTEAS